MTGIMPHLGMQSIRQGVPQDVTMLPQVMRNAGYSTHHVGKWHLGMTRKWMYPSERGFDSSFGFMDGQADYVTQQNQFGIKSSWPCSGVDLQQNAEPALGMNGTFSYDWFRNHISKALEGELSKPIFLFVALQAMHTPSPGPEMLQNFIYEYQTKGVSDESYVLSNALITFADHVLKHAADLLRAKNMWENTLLIHLSDNGGQIVYGSHGNQGNNFPLRGMKRSFFEGGVRVPAFVTGGALPIGGRGKLLSGYIHIADWYATIAELAGHPTTVQAAQKSRSMAAYLSGDVSTSPRTSMILGAGDTDATCNYVESVIQGAYKLINGSIPCSWASYQGPLYPNASTVRIGFKVTAEQMAADDCVLDKTTFLFNIREDPHELVNLADSHPVLLSNLQKMLMQARKESKGCFPTDHDRGEPNKADFCESFVRDNYGFVGPYMEGRERRPLDEEFTVRLPHPLAFTDSDVYTDE
jgi:arylsulfatase B